MKCVSLEGYSANLEDTWQLPFLSTGRQARYFASPLFWHGTKAFFSERRKGLGKACFVRTGCVECSLPSVTLSKNMVEYFQAFAECSWHSSYKVIPTVSKLFSRERLQSFFQIQCVARFHRLAMFARPAGQSPVYSVLPLVTRYLMRTALVAEVSLE